MLIFESKIEFNYFNFVKKNSRRKLVLAFHINRLMTTADKVFNGLAVGLVIPSG